MRFLSQCYLLLCAVILFAATTHAVEDEAAAAARKAAGAPPPMRGAEMQYGPVLSCSVELPPPPGMPVVPTGKPSPPDLSRVVAAKGLVIKLGEGADAGAVCLDTEMLRMAAGWTGGFLDLRKTNIASYKGIDTGSGVIAGKMFFSTARVPEATPQRGTAVTADAGDARAGVPQDSHFNGFYLHGDRVILSYKLQGRDVLESPEILHAGIERVLLRRFTVGPARVPLQLAVAQATYTPSKWETAQGNRTALSSAPPDFREFHGQLHEDGDQHWAVAVSEGRRSQIRIWGDETQAYTVAIPDSEDSVSFTVALWRGAEADFPRGAVFTPREPIDLRTLCTGGPARWPEPITAAGTVAGSDAAYVIDTLPIPEENPWKSWMRISAFDFFQDGRAAVATLNGEVWIVAGLDEKLEQVSWRRFAVGFYEPLGLKIVDGKILVHGRDGITRLHDLNGDGEADFYEAFSRDRPVFPSYHGFAFDLDADRAGNLYYAVGGNWLGKDPPWHSCVVKVSADGAKSEVLATGFRAPNGLAVGPNDEIIVSDNQGSWVPASKISLIRPGAFYGHVADPRTAPKAEAPPGFEPPLCYIPMALDNSSGGAVWVRGGKWGPFEGRLLHTSYGSASLFAVLEQRVGEVAQGGVVRFPLKFASGIMRARFGPHDGQLYVAGLKGWQTAGAKEGCLQRVRYTGHPVRLPTGLRVGKDALTIEFPVALDPATATDPQSYAIEQWNYKWSSTYGSPDLSVSDPNRKGRDSLEITAARLSDDAKEITLTVPGLQPVMQMSIKLQLQTADGAEIRTEIANTINRVP